MNILILFIFINNIIILVSLQKMHPQHEHKNIFFILDLVFYQILMLNYKYA